MDIQKIEKEMASIARRCANPHTPENEKGYLTKRYSRLAEELYKATGIPAQPKHSIKSESQEVADCYRRVLDERVRRFYKSWDSPIFDEYSTLQPIKTEPPKPVVMVDIPEYGEAPDNFKPHEFQWSENKSPREIRAMGSEFAMFQLIGKKW